MNKFKKTAIVATSIVMAGTMAFGIAACGGSRGGGSTTEWDASEWVSTLNSTYGLSDRTSANASGWTTAKSYWTYLSNNLSSTVSTTGASRTYASGTQLGIAIGHNSYDTGAFYSAKGTYVISSTMTVSGGYQASTGTLKPAMKALQDELDVTFVDGYTGEATSSNLSNTDGTGLVNTSAWGDTVDIATSDLSVAVTQATTNNNILNLAKYLDQMPNFKQFLEDNPVVYLSLLQSGMSTTDGSSKSIYVAPYFDGNDDIERYCLIRQDWVEDLLDDDLSYDGDTYKVACADDTSATGWMGTTGSYTIETSTEADEGATTFNLKKDYSAALSAAADSTTALGAAYNAIAGAAYTGASGNIVDIMNEAIAANNGATGKQLATLYRAYIDVAYTNASTGAAAYTDRSDLFNGYSAAWDVDDLVAMLRIVKTNSENVGLDSYSSSKESPVHTEGIFPRDGTNDRTPDIVRLAAQLYGERGADSRYEYTYIDNSGNLQDARANTSFWECLEQFGTLASEGLVYDYYSTSAVVSIDGTTLKGNGSNLGNGFMEYDYSQTQTTQMFSTMLDDDYMFGAINTPVSKWDVNGDGTKETIMRFTESWRSTKTGGLVLAASLEKTGNEDKLEAALAFIDYLFSNDGQITSTFGQQASSAAGTDGTWYGNEVTSAVVSDTSITVNGTEVATLQGGQMVVKDSYKSQYFCFKNKLYTGTLYKGEMTPTVTDGLYSDFTTAKSVENSVNSVFDAQGNFTNYARRVLGSTLPMGNKNQSFENQLTAKEAAAAATKVSASINNGTIKHVTLEVNSNNYWYTTVPTGLPLSTTQQGVIDSTDQTNLKGMTGTNVANSKNFAAIFHHIIWYGYTGTYSYQGITVSFT